MTIKIVSVCAIYVGQDCLELKSQKACQMSEPTMEYRDQGDRCQRESNKYFVHTAMLDSDNHNQRNKNSSKRLAKDLEIFVK